MSTTWYHPIVEGQPDEDVRVEGMQLRPDNRADVLAWAGPGVELLSGGLLLLDGSTVVGTGELGDFVLFVDGARTLEKADGFGARWQPAE